MRVYKGTKYGRQEGERKRNVCKTMRDRWIVGKKRTGCEVRIREQEVIWIV